MSARGYDPDAAWLVASPLTVARLAAFGATAFFEDARATRRLLPAGSSARALSALRWRARDAGRLLRLVIDDPGHPIAPAAAREVARLFAEWPALAADLHPDFRPLASAPPYKLSEGFDAIGVPVALREAIRNKLATERKNGCDMDGAA